MEATSNTTYDVNPTNARRRRKDGALVDRGANGCVFGDDVRPVACPASQPKVDVSGFDAHKQTDMPIVTAAGVVRSHVGNLLVIIHQGALYGKGRTILSPTQMEAFGIDVSDKHKIDGGLQCIATPDGYLIPIAIRNGLPYIDIRPFTDEEWEELPHTFLTSDEDWVPSRRDHDPEEDEDDWVDAVQHLAENPHAELFDQEGNYRRVHPITTDQYQPTQAECNTHCVEDDDTVYEDIEDCVDYCVMFHEALTTQPDTTWYDSTDEGWTCCNGELQSPAGINSTPKPRTVSSKTPDYKALRPLFAWLPEDIVRKTFEKTTQYARMPVGTFLKKRYRSPFPAANVPRRNEPVATDKIVSDTPAVDSGATQAQVFVGTESQLTDVYATRSDKEFVNAFQDNIRARGAPTKLLSDGGRVEIMGRVKDLLRYYVIDAWWSEPGMQNQNPSERRINTIKSTTNKVMDRTGSPPDTWLLCLMYVCFLLNNVFNTSTNGIPLQAATGSTNDISPLLCFRWWEPVYYRLDDSNFPSDSREGRGRFVGIAETVGHIMTFKVLTDDTRKVIYRSSVRSALSAQERNLRLDPLNDTPVGDKLREFVRSHCDKAPPVGTDDGEEDIPDLHGRQGGHPRDDTDPYETEGPDQAGGPVPPPIFHPSDLVGRTFLMDEEDDGTRCRARIVEALDEHEQRVEGDKEVKKFRVSIRDDEYEELLTYDEVLRHITARENDNEGIVWKFRRIVAHQGPLRPHDPAYNGSSYNVMVEWENGEITTEPLAVIGKDDPATVAKYAYDNELLDLDGWKRFKKLAKNQKKLLRQVNQAKMRSFRTSPRYKYGYEVPRDYKHAVILDERNGNTRWQDACALELEQQDSYKTFRDLGKHAGAPKGYTQIKVHFVFDVKHDGRHKARLVADGHLTDVPTESVYSGVVSLRGLRLILFLAELNGMETWATDIGNAYLEAETREKVYIKAGPEFGERQGHTLIIFKALYGLRSSGLRWHERLADCLRGMGFAPCKSEPDIWMRRVDDHYEYIGVYVDDLCIASKDPKSIIQQLQSNHGFNLKGTGPISFHLGCDFVRDQEGVLCIRPAKFIDKMTSAYEQFFGTKPPRTNVKSPLEKGDHPETDTSDFLTDEQKSIYQSLIGSLQWAVSLARFDIASAVMTMSSFRAMPRQGHLERVKRICAYLAKMRNGAIRIETQEPDLSDIEVPQYDWAASVYGDVKEDVPNNAPEPLGPYVQIVHYVDANLFHDYLTGRSVTGILDLLNGTPIDWYSKKQATVETATYGSEFIAARTCTERSIELRNTLRYLGVRIRESAYMFGDNKSVVDSSSIPHFKLHKRHNQLSFHRVREAIAAGIVNFIHIGGETNPADMLSKHWGYQQTWCNLQPLLFYPGNETSNKE